jgi:hypothetical protein
LVLVEIEGNKKPPDGGIVLGIKCALSVCLHMATEKHEKRES